MRELHNVEAEQAVLGSLLIDPAAYRDVAYFLEPDDFHVRRNRLIFGAMGALHEDGAAIDFVTVADQLDRVGELEKVGGAGYLTELLECVPSAMRADDYARIVARRSIDRKIQSVASEVGKLAFQDLPPEEKLLLAQTAVDSIDIVGGRSEVMTADQAATVLGDLAEQYAEEPLSEDGVRGFSTGIKDLDRMLRGFKAGLYLIGGVTHVGKSAFVIQLAANVARAGGSVLLVETEDTHEAMWARIYALESGIDLDDVERGLEPDDLAWYREVQDACRAWDLEVIAKSVTVPQIAVEVKSRDLDLLVVDNLENPAMGCPGESNWERFRTAAYRLLSVAQENAVPILTTMQVSKHKLSQRSTKVPQMEDLYGADGPSQAASVVLTLHRDDVWNVGTGADPTHKIAVYCFKDKLAHRGAGERTVLQFGGRGEVRDLARTEHAYVMNQAPPEPEDPILF